MRKTFWILSLVAVLAILFGPVLIALASPQEERKLAGVRLEDLRYREAAFRNEVQDLDLAGMLFIPEGEGPFPGVVIIHGAGTSQRDNPWYLSLVSYLQQNGVAVLLPDKRGSVNSGGDWHTSSFEDLATDTLAAVQYMNTQDFFEVSQIGIIGLSQGGQLSPLAAAQSKDIAFLVDVVGTSLPLYEVLHYEEANNLREMGFLPFAADLIAYPSTYVLRNVTQKDFWDAAGNFDALPYWQTLSIPALVLYGSADTNVPAEASKARLEALGKENIQVKVYEGSGHKLEDPEGSGNRYFRGEALMDIHKFILAAAPPAAAQQDVEMTEAEPAEITFAEPNFVFQGDDPGAPIVTHNPTPEIANTYINPGAIIFHEGRFHMFFNSFTGWPGVIEVGYMTSPDGTHWEMAQDAPVFKTDQIPYGDGQADVSAVIVKDDGTWAMYFHTIGEGEIGRATARSPRGPWTPDPEPALRPNPEGWDQYGLAWPSVVRDGEAWRMYYGVKAQKGYAIGMAISSDGVDWTKHDDPATSERPYHESDPVLTASEKWEYGKVDRPRAARTPDGWVMVYQAGAKISDRSLALSNDGLTWEKYPGNPFLTAEAFPLKNAKAWDTTLVYHEGTYYYFMEVGTLGGTNLFVATHQGALRK